MIKKLDVLKDTDNIFDRDGLIANVPNGVMVINKINELVDVVNSIASVQEKLIDSRFVVETKHEETADKFAEQRKWIGKLCKFRDNPACTWKYGILKEIFEDVEFPFWDIDCYEYAECELVKPDDDIIYKGE